MSYKKKQWRLRLKIVRELQEWVFENLKDIPPTYQSMMVITPSTPQYKRRKSKQYVIENLALGKMMHPQEIRDPLFTFAKYDDESLRQQLKNEQYEVFENILREKITAISEADLRSESEVT